VPVPAILNTASGGGLRRSRNRSGIHFFSLIRGILRDICSDMLDMCLRSVVGSDRLWPDDGIGPEKASLSVGIMVLDELSPP